MTEHRIPFPHPVPANYKRRFVFLSERFRHEISIDGKPELVIQEHGICNPKKASKCLDWIEQAVYEIRQELGI